MPVDIVKLMSLLDRMDVPEKDRCILVSAGMYEDLMKINQFISFDFNKTKPVVDGSIGSILGANVFKRSRTAIYDSAGVKNSFGDSVLATDCDSVLAWHKSTVRRAEGTAKVYANLDDPQLLGSSFSTAVRGGGTSGRIDEKGVVSIVEDFVS